MDQIKIGAFLKVLRKEKNLTQEQLAEQLGVSGRTVSRWETGNNMPDISLLVEIAEFYALFRIFFGFGKIDFGSFAIAISGRKEVKRIGNIRFRGFQIKFQCFCIVI